jgi:hypothetical protein
MSASGKENHITILPERILIPAPLPEEMLGRPLKNHLKFQAVAACRSALKREEEPEAVRYLPAFTKKEEISWDSEANQPAVHGKGEQDEEQ